MTSEAAEIAEEVDLEHAVLVAYENFFERSADGASAAVLDVAARVALGVSALVTHRVGTC